MSLFSLPEILSKASAAFKRFPLTLLWSIVGSFFIVIVLEIDDRKLFNEFQNIFMVLLLGISWLISAQFYVEQFKEPKKYWWVKILVFLFLGIVYFTLPSVEKQDAATVTYIRYALFIVAGHLALFFTPFAYSWHSKSYANYLGSILLAIARSLLFAGVLYLGLVLALAAIDFLFNIDIDGKRYGQLFVLCLGIVNTWVYLSDFPENVHHNIQFIFPKPAEVFVKYILIPLVALYFIILYAYSLKIVINWELPKGWVSYLVTALAGLLFIIQLIINPVQKSHSSRLIKKFHPLFYWLLLPLLLLLYVAIYKRTSEYGITENRYFVWAIAFFITVTTLYLLFSRKRQLRWLPMGLFLIALIASVGPWSASSVAKRSQLKQFEKVYAFAKAQTSKTIDRTAYDRLNSITRFLTERDAIDQTEKALGFNPKMAFKNVSNWEMSQKIMDTLGLRPNAALFNNPGYFSRNYDSSLEIKGYDYYKQISVNRNINTQYAGKINKYSFVLIDQKNEIAIKKEAETVLVISLDSLRNELLRKEYSNVALQRDQLKVVAQNDQIAVCLYFQDITFNQSPKNNRKIEYGTIDVLLREITND